MIFFNKACIYSIKKRFLHILTILLPFGSLHFQFFEDLTDPIFFAKFVCDLFDL